MDVSAGRGWKVDAGSVLMWAGPTGSEYEQQMLCLVAWSLHVARATFAQERREILRRFVSVEFYRYFIVHSYIGIKYIHQACSKP